MVPPDGSRDVGFPSTEQQTVIEHRGRPLVVVAGPGTGKTRTLVERMIALLQEDPESEISFITFTRTSRRDTQRKFRERFGEKFKLLSPSGISRASTLHTYAKSIVYRHSDAVGRNRNFSILIERMGEKKLVLAELVSDLGLKVSIEDLDEAIATYRCTAAWPEGWPAEERLRDCLLEEFERLLRFYNTFDIEGLVCAAVVTLQARPDLPPVYLHVDEYQDLNPVDQTLVKLAALHPESQVVVVGDDAQSIYGFRHADFKGLGELWGSKEWDKVPFTECHRLPAHILRAAQTLIARQGYLGGCLVAGEGGEKKLLTLRCTKDSLQAEAIACRIRYLRRTAEQQGHELRCSDFMVLCPTAKQVANMAKVLHEKFEIPTRQPKMLGQIPPDHWRLLLVLRMLHSSDSLALRQWMDVARVPPDEVQALRRLAQKAGSSLYEYCRSLGRIPLVAIFDALDRLRDTIGDGAAFRQALLEFPDLMITPELFPDIGLTLDELTGGGFSVGSVITGIYEKYGLVDRDTEVPDEDRVLVATLHAAKGLEAEHVFVSHLTATFMPMANWDFEEARRVFYVALTRAKCDVVLLLPESFRDGRTLLEPSPFLGDIKDHLDVQRITAKDVRGGRADLFA